MTRAAFIAGDWGLTSLRLHLCTSNGVVDRRDGPGIGRLATAPDETLHMLVEPWLAEHGPLPVVLAGMVGSNIGWKASPYIDCPAGLDAFRNAHVLEVSDGLRVRIAGGMTCINPLGQADFMRGEETQLFGALSLYPQLRSGKHLVVLPGTHAKWALLKDACIVSFQSALTGELYDLTLRHSILVDPRWRSAKRSAVAFEAGVRRGLETGDADLVHCLFEARALQIDGRLAASEAAAWLSGLLVSKDVGGALRLFAPHDSASPICVIGTPHLTAIYGRALELAGHDSKRLDGEEAVVAGLRSIIEGTQDV